MSPSGREAESRQREHKRHTETEPRVAVHIEPEPRYDDNEAGRDVRLDNYGLDVSYKPKFDLQY